MAGLLLAVGLLGAPQAEWTGVGGSMDAWTFTDDGEIRCSGAKGKGHAPWIATRKTYSDFDLSLEFKAYPDSNSGVFVRAPLEGNPAKAGFEVQLFDNDSKTYSGKPRLVWTGSVWNVAAPTADVHKAAGEWQTLRILCVGAYCAVWHNGTQVVSIRLDDYPDLLKMIPGIARTGGVIGLQNHGAPFAFRNVVIREVTDPSAHPAAPVPGDGRTAAHPPRGFVPLFNGKDLAGWKVDGDAADHWTVKDGVIHYDGKGKSLRTVEEFGDFILYADWKIAPGGDSGIFPRGRPQVQIWDRARHPEGSGGLWNNKKTHAGEKPSVPADNPAGEWNTFRIRLVGEKIWVHLNGRLVVDGAPMETLRRKDQLIERGPVVLQHHGHPLWFRNLWIKELER